MTTLTVKIPESLAAELDAEARQKHRSKSSVARDALTNYLYQKNRAPKTSCYDLAEPFVGCVKDGPPDLSSNQEYLKGFGRD